ncbi:hypothetical protein HZC00_01825 [Candidatus Kaiserbacteria bacterium]|nr:hypothetical protein [Candidatus Kaiserbacteria bacterium]
MSSTITFPGKNPLEHAGDVDVQPYPGKFSASNTFAIGSIIGGIPVGNVSSEFMALFCTIPFGKPTKKPLDFPAASIPYWNLTRATHDSDIFHIWMGGKNRVHHLVRVFQIMSLGKKGPSLMNGLANIAFAPPVFSVEPRTIYWSVSMGTWHLEAIPGSASNLRTTRLRCRLPTGVRIFGGICEETEHEPLAF